MCNHCVHVTMGRLVSSQRNVSFLAGEALPSALQLLTFAFAGCLSVTRVASSVAWCAQFHCSATERRDHIYYKVPLAPLTQEARNERLQLSWGGTGVTAAGHRLTRSTSPVAYIPPCLRPGCRQVDQSPGQTKGQIVPVHTKHRGPPAKRSSSLRCPQQSASNIWICICGCNGPVAADGRPCAPTSCHCKGFPVG